MSPERWRRIEVLYQAALDRRPEERSEFLAQSCGDDAELKHAVELLLAQPTSNTLLDDQLSNMHAVAPKQALTQGALLGQYRVLEHLGSGGMGTVYKALDTKLGRQVALKLLHPEVVIEGGGLARFKREARALASLNNPHIAAIYDFEEQDGVPYLVLEYVSGPTLAERLRRGPLPPREAFAAAKQIAEALETAHRAGIIHRDLKPANIKLRDDGQIKVLDFGLAKRFAQVRSIAATGLAPAASEELTRPMALIGTPAYMSPEQACGKELDAQTDIWSFGCVLYETLTGRPAFGGATITETLASIVEREPNWGLLRPSTPAAVRTLLRRMLEKDPRQRLRDIGDAALELEDVLNGRAPLATAVGRASAWRDRAFLVGAACGLLVAALALAVTQWQQPSHTVHAVRFSVPYAPGELLRPSNSTHITISPDGLRVAYLSMPEGAAGGQVWMRALDQSEGKPVADAVGGVPFFSPDGKWLGFWHGPTQTLRKLALSGGAPVSLAVTDSIAGATWGEDGNIVWGLIDLLSVPAGGGPVKTLLKVDAKNGDRVYRQPWYLPGGKAILFTVGREDLGSFNDAQIAVLSLETGKKKVLIEGGMCPRYSPSGHLVYARAGGLLAVPFDLKTLSVSGQPVPVVDGVFMSVSTGMAAFAISAKGDLVYAPGPVASVERLPLWVDRKGVPKRLPLPPRAYLHPRLSPDERQVVMEIEAPTHDSYFYDISRDALTRFSFDGTTHWPIWTPSGDRVAFRSGRTPLMSMWWMPADRSGNDERLTPVEGNMQTPESWYPDGRALLFTQRNQNTGADIFALSIDGDRKPRPLVQTRFDEGAPKFSPDGHWVSYCSNESGRPEVYVTTYPGPGPRVQVSTNGGSDPVWRHKGGELYYRHGDKMMAVSVSSGPKLALSKPHILWIGDFMYGSSSSCGGPGVTSTDYDVTADGERFFMIEERTHQAVTRQVNVVLGWAEELKQVLSRRSN